MCYVEYKACKTVSANASIHEELAAADTTFVNLRDLRLLLLLFQQVQECAAR